MNAVKTNNQRYRFLSFIFLISNINTLYTNRCSAYSLVTWQQKYYNLLVFKDFTALKSVFAV